MSTITDIRSSLTIRHAELTSELGKVNDALAALGDTAAAVIVTDQPVKDSDQDRDAKRQKQLDNLAKARAARQSNLAKQRKSNGRKSTAKKSGRKSRKETYSTRAEEILALTNQGMSVDEIAAETDAHKSYIYAVRRDSLKAA